MVTPWQQVVWGILTLAMFLSWWAWFARREADDFTLAERLVAAFIGTVIQIIATTFILGWLHQLRYWPLGIVNAVIAITLAVWVGRSQGGRSSAGEIALAWRTLWRLVSTSGAVAAAGAITVLATIWVVYLGTLLPLYDYDVWAYHLSWVAYAHQEGSLGPFPMPWPFVDCYPMNTQILFLWAVIGTNTDQWANIVQTPFAYVSALSCYLLARHIGARRIDAALIGLLIFSIPTVLHQMWTAKVDLAITGGTLVTLAFLSRRRFTASSLVVAGCAAGFFIGCKGSGMILAIGLLLFLIYRLLTISTDDFGLPKGKRFSTALIALLIVIIPAFLLGSFFYLRNWVMYGNPAGIFEVKIGSINLYEGIDLKALLWRANLVPSALYDALETGNEWPIVLDGFFDPQSAFWQGGFIGGWGSPWTTLMLPAVPVAFLLGFIRRKWIVPAIILTCLIPYFLFSSVHHVWTRYYLPVIAVGTTSLAYMLVVLDRSWIRRAIRVIAVASMLATVFVASQHLLVEPEHIREARALPYAERNRFLAFNSWGDRDFADALILVQEPGTTLAFTGHPPLRKNRALWNATYTNRAVWVPWDSDGEEWELRLRSEGADAVLMLPDSDEMRWGIMHLDRFQPLYVGELGGIFRMVKEDNDGG